MKVWSFIGARSLDEILTFTSSRIYHCTMFKLFPGRHRSSASTALDWYSQTLIIGHHTRIFFWLASISTSRVTGRPRSTKPVDELQTNKRRNSKILRRSMWMGWSVSFYPGCPLIAFYYTHYRVFEYVWTSTTSFSSDIQSTLLISLTSRCTIHWHLSRHFHPSHRYRRSCNTSHCYASKLSRPRKPTLVVASWTCEIGLWQFAVQTKATWSIQGW